MNKLHEGKLLPTFYEYENRFVHNYVCTCEPIPYSSGKLLFYGRAFIKCKIELKLKNTIKPIVPLITFTLLTETSIKYIIYICICFVYLRTDDFSYWP